MRMYFPKPRRWGRAVAVVVLGLVVATLGVVLAQGEVKAQDDCEFEPEVSVELSDYDSDVNADVTTSFDVPGTSYNYGTLVSFTPEEFFPGEEVPIGAKVGELDSLATLGTLNGPCSTPLQPHFDLYWATTDTSSTVTFDEQFANDPVPRTHPGIHDGIHYYPDFALRILPGETPVQRMYGYDSVAGTDVTINFVVFEPGALGYPSAWGPPSVILLNDIGDPEAPAVPEAITDFCTPLESTTVTFGLSEDNPDTGDDESGYEVRRNPPYGGTYTFRWYTRSMLDADGDCIENYLDTCPYDATPEWDPKSADPEWDPDGDGMPGKDAGGDTLEPGTGCDPKPITKHTDGDLDAFMNRGDNCPLVENPLQEDGDTDDIGDDCDDYPGTPDGVPIELTIEEDVEISGPALGEDSDGDGFDDVTEEDLGSDPDDPDSTPEHTSVAGTCTDDEDNDLDGYIDDIDGGCAEDTDGDGASDEGEEELGSDPDDADSTPEDLSVEGSCTDGVDNDGDGLTDGDDPGCAVPEETPTPTPTPEVEVTPTPEVEVTPTPEVEVEICPPVFPGTYSGLVRIDGQPAASGYRVTASIDDIEWGSAIVSGGRYAMDIPDHLPTEAPCFEGGTITFELNGMACTPVQEGADVWASGLRNVDLTCAPPATPVPTPPATPTATPTPATPTPTPVKPPPTGAGGLSGPGSGLPLWAMALAGWVGLMTVAGLGTLVAAKRR